MGLFIILNEKYSIERFGNRRNMVKRKTKKNEDILDRYKRILSIFSITLGIFCLINYIIF
ncbi:MAG: hypothetical protein GX329_03320 [Tissierellia bacterium]|nr:hypothetical protein [Tissierellia bacterium]